MGDMDKGHADIINRPTGHRRKDNDKMRHVFTNDETCHVWSTQTQEEGKNHNGSIFFDGPVIYSYGRHFPMARLIPGTDIVLFTTESYGQTTACHKGLVSRAVSHKTVICVPNVVKPGYYPETEKATKYHTDNLEAIHKDAISLRNKATRARTYGEHYLTELAERTQDAEVYFNTFRKEMDKATARAWRRKLTKGIATPEEVKALNDKIKATRKIQAKKDKEKRAREMVEYNEMLPRWIAGDMEARLPYWIQPAPPASLRIKDGQVETTQGARIPLPDARKAYRLIKAGRGDSLKGQRIAYYTVTSITDKLLTVGCHRIELAEIDRIGPELMKDAPAQA